MIRRALDREVERDLKSVLVCCRDEPAEIFTRAKLPVDRIMPALVAADRVRAAGVAGGGVKRVIAPLAVLLADRMDRRKIKDVEAHLANIGKARDHIVERAVPIDISGLRARKQLVPAREFGLRPFDLQRQRRMLCAKGALGRCRDGF